MSYLKSVYSRIQTWLDENNWKYSWDESKGNFIWKVTLNNDVENILCILHMEKDHYIVYAVAPFKVQPECKNNTLKLLNDINCGMIFGCFEMNENASEIRFRFPVDCENATPAKSVIQKSIILPAQMFMKFGNEILGVATGKISAENAIQAIRPK